MPRIVGGTARGRRLSVPRGDRVRPTSDKVREALFNVLRHRFGDPADSARVLDLFAGAGTLGLEALSRGAAEVVFVEADRRHGQVLRENLAVVAKGCPGRATVVQSRVERHLDGTASAFDLVFLDPPYGVGAVAPTVTRLAAGGWLGPSALICVEHPAREAPEAPPGFESAFARTWGSTAITVFARAPSPGSP